MPKDEKTAKKAANVGIKTPEARDKVRRDRALKAQSNLQTPGPSLADELRSRFSQPVKPLPGDNPAVQGPSILDQFFRMRQDPFWQFVDQRRNQPPLVTTAVDPVRYAKEKGYRMAVDQVVSKREERTPGTVANAVHELTALVGNGWKARPDLSKSAYQFLYSRQQENGQVTDGDIAAVRDSLIAGDMRRLDAAVKERVNRKYGRDPSKDVLSFPAEEYIGARSEGKKVVQLWSGGVMSLDLAEEQIAAKTGMTPKEYLLRVAPDYRSLIQMRNQDFWRSQLADMEQHDWAWKNFLQMFGYNHSREDQDKSFLQMMGEGVSAIPNMAFHDLPYMLSYYTTNLGAHKGAQEYGLTVDQLKGLMESPEMGKTIQEGTIRASIVPQVAALIGSIVYPPLAASLAAIDYGGMGMEQLGALMSGGEGQRMARESLMQRLDSINPTNKQGWERVMSSIGLLGQMADFLGGAHWLVGKRYPHSPEGVTALPTEELSVPQDTAPIAQPEVVKQERPMIRLVDDGPPAEPDIQPDIPTIEEIVPDPRAKTDEPRVAPEKQRATTDPRATTDEPQVAPENFPSIKEIEAEWERQRLEKGNQGKAVDEDIPTIMEDADPEIVAKVDEINTEKAKQSPVLGRKREKKANPSETTGDTVPPAETPKTEGKRLIGRIEEDGVDVYEDVNGVRSYVPVETSSVVEPSAKVADGEQSHSPRPEPTAEPPREEAPRLREDGAGGDTERVPVQSPREGQGRPDAVDGERGRPQSGDGTPPERNAPVKGRLSRLTDAIDLSKKIEAEGRVPTPEETDILSQFPGWGWVGNLFHSDHANPAHARFKDYEAIRSRLTPEEFASASRATLNSHYTSPEVVKAMHHALNDLGINGGNILEPSAGTGAFIRNAPEGNSYKWSAAELDPTTARILSQLHPDATVHSGGYETAPFRGGTFKAAISNVPFGDIKIADLDMSTKAGKAVTRRIHNYFIAKAFDHVEDNGIVAVVTSAGTMNASDAVGMTARTYLAKKGDFIGGVRLPNNAFRKEAVTDVTTDILFFKKRPDGAEPGGKEFQRVVPIDTETGPGMINEYFANHPEQVLGTHGMDGKLHGGAKEKGQYTVHPNDRPLEPQLREAIARITSSEVGKRDATAPLPSSGTSHVGTTPRPAKEQAPKRKGSLVVKDDGTVEVAGGDKIELSAKDAAIVKGFTDIRDTFQDLLSAQMADGVSDLFDQGKHPLQGQLNTQYEAFVKKNGSLYKNRRLFIDDPLASMVLSLEKLDPKTQAVVGRADIFSKRVMQPAARPKAVESAQDAVIAVLYERGRVDVKRMAELSGKSEKEILKDVDGKFIFEDPEHGWVTASQYARGNVRAKLRAAEQLAEKNKRYKPYVEFLKQHQPPHMPMSKISPQLGAGWIPPDVYKQFVASLVGTDPRGLELAYFEKTNKWVLDYWKGSNWATGLESTEVHGTRDVPLMKLLEHALVGSTPQVTYRVDGKPTVDPVATNLAIAKLDELRDKFHSFVYGDLDIASALEQRYNDTVNVYAEPPRYTEGESLDFPGMNPAFSLEPHQKHAVWRTLSEPAVLYAHDVGTGKTFTAYAATMTMRRLGVRKKIVHVVKNDTISQYVGQGQSLFPGMKVLWFDGEGLDAANRRKLMGQIAANDYDAIVMSYSAFTKLPLNPKIIIKQIEKELASLNAEMSQTKGRGNNDSISKYTQKDIEKVQENLRARRDEAMQALKKNQDDTIFFDELGIDHVFVDEAHNFKGVPIATKIEGANVPGEAQRAIDLDSKLKVVREKGGGITLMTGTPIDNSVTELFNVFRYLAPDELSAAGMGSFDQWAQSFARVKTSLEPNLAQGGYAPKTRMAAFKNMGELMRMYLNYADVVTIDDLVENSTRVSIPKRVDMEGRPSSEPIIVASDANPDQLAYFKTLPDRHADVKSKKVEPTEDNFLKITSDGRMASLDARLVDRNAIDDPNSKANQLVKKILHFYKDPELSKRKATQAVSMNMVSISHETPWGFSLAKDIKQKLIAGGIPEKEIAFFSEFNNTKKKLAFFDDFNDGKVRVVFGPAKTLGTGTNIQKRLAVLHHLDVDLKPAQMEQFNGRGFRQGNTMADIGVREIRYVSKGTYDEWTWNTVQRKAMFIQQIKEGRLDVREIEDINPEGAADLQLMVSIAANDPRMPIMFNLQKDVNTLRSLKKSHEATQLTYKGKMAKLKNDIPEMEMKKKSYERMLEADPYPEEFAVKTRYSEAIDEQKKAGALVKAMILSRSYDRAQLQYGGFGLDFLSDMYDPKSRVMVRVTHQPSQFTSLVDLNYTREMIEALEETGYAGLMQRIVNRIDGFKTEPDNIGYALDRARKDLETAGRELGKPFDREEELLTKSTELAKLQADMNAKAKAAGVRVEEEDTADLFQFGGAGGAALVGEGLDSDKDEKDRNKWIVAGLAVLAMLAARRGMARSRWGVAMAQRWGEVVRPVLDRAWSRGVAWAFHSSGLDPSRMARVHSGDRLGMTLDRLLAARANMEARVGRDLHTLNEAMSKAYGKKWNTSPQARASLMQLRDKLEQGQALTSQEASLVQSVQQIHSKFPAWAWKLGIGVQDANSGTMDHLIGSAIRATMDDGTGKFVRVEGQIKEIDPDGTMVVEDAKGDEWELPVDAPFQRPIHELGTAFVPRVVTKKYGQMLRDLSKARSEAAHELVRTKKEPNIKAAFDAVDSIAKARTIAEKGRPTWFNYVQKFNDIAEEILAKNPQEFTTIDDAREWLQALGEQLHKENDIVSFMAGLERARRVQLADEAYEADYALAFSRYINNAHKRIALVEQLGNPDPEYLAQLVEGVRQQDIRHGKYLDKVILRLFRLGPDDEEFGRGFAANEGAIQSMLKLTAGTTPLAQISDLVTVASRAEFGAWPQALAKLVNKDNRTTALIMTNAERQFFDTQDARPIISRIAGIVHTATGLTHMDRLVKVASYTVAMEDMKRVLQRAANGPVSNADIRKLTRYGVTSGDLALAAKGDIKVLLDSEKFMNKVAANIRRDLIYTGAIEDNPIWTSSPIGSAVMRLRKPVYYSTKFLVEDVLNEARNGNLRPLFKMLVIGGLSGEAIAEIKEKIGGRKHETFDEAIGKKSGWSAKTLAALIHAVDNLQAVGNLGVAQELFSPFNRDVTGKLQPEKAFLPVSVDDAFGIWSETDAWATWRLGIVKDKMPPQPNYGRAIKQMFPLLKRLEYLSKQYEKGKAVEPQLQSLGGSTKLP